VSFRAHAACGRRATAPIPLRMPRAGAVRRRQYPYACRERAPCDGANTPTHAASGRRATAPIPLRMPRAGAVRRRQYPYACRERAPCDGANTPTHAGPRRTVIASEIAYETGRSVSFRTHARPRRTVIASEIAYETGRSVSFRTHAGPRLDGYSFGNCIRNGPFSVISYARRTSTDGYSY